VSPLNEEAPAPGTSGLASSLSGPVESAGSGVQGEPATAPAMAHESLGDEQVGTPASPLARSISARQSTGGTHSAPSLAAAVSPAGTGTGTGLPLRHLRTEAECLTCEYQEHPERFK
jgi:hypothetical protein